jgi:hypothetical protein
MTARFVAYRSAAPIRTDRRDRTRGRRRDTQRLPARFHQGEVVTFADYDRYGGEAGAKAVGKLRVEGKDYVMQDGDVVHFRFNV